MLCIFVPSSIEEAQYNPPSRSEKKNVKPVRKNLQNYYRAVQETMDAHVSVEAKSTAFASGLHTRLGSASNILLLDNLILFLILGFVKKGHIEWRYFIDGVVFPRSLIFRQRSYGWTHTNPTTRKKLRLPPLRLVKSTENGTQLISVESMPQDTIVSEFGGELIAMAEYKARCTTILDHFLFSGTNSRCSNQVIDGSVHDGFPESYFIIHHMLGSFVRFTGNRDKANSVQCFMADISNGYFDPYGNDVCRSERVYLKTSRNVRAGEELLVYRTIKRVL